MPVEKVAWEKTAGPRNDEGLRAYMLHGYNYMVFGLAITGLAALSIYWLP